MADTNTSSREGGIEAPTRYPLKWQEAEFWDEQALHKELERAYDICHGCRRCVSLCEAFPTLFDLVDESETMEVDGVAKDDFMKVVDQCYLCDLCYQTKCPYVPPHPWELDFPHLMLRAKAQDYRKNKAPVSRRLLSATTTIGKVATLPVVVQLANKVSNSKTGRKMMDKTLGIHPDALVPKYVRPTLEKRAANLEQANPAEARQVGRTRGKVAIFGTCYGNYNRPELGEDLIRILQHNGIVTHVVQSSVCCGMPKLELGDLASVEKLKQSNIPILAKLVDEGWDILTPIPSCTLMFKQELPLMFPEDADVAKVREHSFDPFEYLSLRQKGGAMNTEFPVTLGKIAYHAPCHQRVQNIGPKTKEILNLIPDTEIKMIERCSGHDGTYGVRKETYDLSRKIARPVVNRIKKVEPDFVSSDCPLAGDHLEHGLKSGQPAQHPISLLRKAYGI